MTKGALVPDDAAEPAPRAWEAERRGLPPRGRRPLARRAVTLAVLLAGLVGVAGLAGFLLFTAQIAIREPTSVRSADGIVVLTGGASRIPDAFTLLAQGHGRRLLITGVNPATSPESLGKSVAGGEALLSCCVDLGHKALNTLGNAIEAAEWTRSQRFRSILVVTSTWHMPRTLLELGRALPEVEFVPYPVVTSKMQAERWWHDPSTLKLLFKEYLKFVMAAVKIRPARAVASPEAVAPHGPAAPLPAPRAPGAEAQSQEQRGAEARILR